MLRFLPPVSIILALVSDWRGGAEPRSTRPDQGERFGATRSPKVRSEPTPGGLVTVAVYPDATGRFPEKQGTPAGYIYFWTDARTGQRTMAVEARRPKGADLPYDYAYFHPDAPPTAYRDWR